MSHCGERVWELARCRLSALVCGCLSLTVPLCPSFLLSRPRVDVMSVVMFSSGTVHQQKVNGASLVSLPHTACQTSPRWNERGWIGQREVERKNRRRERRTEWGVQLVYGAVISPLQQPEILQYSRVTVRRPNFLQPPWIHMHTKETLVIQQKCFLLFIRNRCHILW